MTKEEVREKIEDIDEEVFLVIIDCFKFMDCDGVPLYHWDYDKVMEYFDKVTENWYE